MRTYIALIFFLFSSILPAAGADPRPELLWWSLQSPQGRPADSAPAETWVATLHWGDAPFQDQQPFSANTEENGSRLSAWVKHFPPQTAALPLLPRKNGYTVPPGPQGNGGITLLGARFHEKDKQFSGSSATLGSMLYPKAVIANSNPCITPGGRDALSLGLEEVPLEIVPVRISPKRSFLKAASWRFVLRVLYLGRPLAGCRVTVHTADNRTQDMTTDKHGLFSVTSQQERPVTERWEHYLFTATRFDPDQDMDHTATLKVIAPPPTLGSGNIIRKILYLGVGLGMLIFAAVMAAVAMTPESKSEKNGRR